MHFVLLLRILEKLDSEEIVSVLGLNKQTNKQINSFTQRNGHIFKGNSILACRSTEEKDREFGEKGYHTMVRDNEEITRLFVAFFVSVFRFLPLLFAVWRRSTLITLILDASTCAQHTCTTHSLNSDSSSFCALMVRLEDNFRQIYYADNRMWTWKKECTVRFDHMHWRRCVICVLLKQLICPKRLSHLIEFRGPLKFPPF